MKTIPLTKGFFAQVDDKDNNQRGNLRFCTQEQNNANRRVKRNKTDSIHKGVFKVLCRNNGKCYTYWRAQVISGGRRYTKNKTSEIEAALIYNEMAKKHFGDFASLNTIH